MNSNGDQIQLVPGGAEKRVTKSNLEEYLRLIVKARLNEAQEQMRAIKEGIDYVIPMKIVRMMTWR